MALDLKLEVCVQDCESLTLIDDTGIYDANNATGWAQNLTDPNPATGDVTSSTVDITIGTNTTNHIVDPHLGNVSIPLTDLGLSGTINDGLIIILWTVSGVVGSGPNVGQDFVYCVETQLYNTCNISCSIRSKYADILLTDCPTCKTDAITSLSELDVYTDAITYAAECGLISKADKILSYVQNKLAIEKCNNC